MTGPTKQRITAAELLFEARLREYIDRQTAKWDADDARKGRPPNNDELNDRLLWEAMIEETEWDRFWGLRDG